MPDYSWTSFGRKLGDFLFLHLVTLLTARIFVPFETMMQTGP